MNYYVIKDDKFFAADNSFVSDIRQAMSMVSKFYAEMVAEMVGGLPVCLPKNGQY